LIRSRNQNSILAVATLGVYLGLILAGATPSVLAQAATAKQFNVKDEAERSENLDRNPAETGASSDDRLNTKITTSVEQLVSKVRGSAGPIATALVVLTDSSDVLDRTERSPGSLYVGTLNSQAITSLIGPRNLARAGIA